MKIFDKITLLNYKRRSNFANVIMISVIVVFAVIILAQFFENQLLRKQMSESIYIQIDNNVYQAKKSYILNAEILDGLTRTAFAYMFNHDEYSYHKNIETAKYYINNQDRQYIITRFEKSDKNFSLLEMYQNYGGRMEYEILEIINVGKGVFLCEGIQITKVEGKKPNRKTPDHSV